MKDTKKMNQRLSSNKNQKSSLMDSVVCQVKAVELDGQARVKVKNQNWLIKGACENEEVVVKFLKRIEQGIVGEVVEVKKANPQRCRMDCRIAHECGGCQYRYMRYQEQLAMKKRQIIRLLEGERIRLKVHDVMGMEVPLAYRNKMIKSFSKDKAGVHFGFYGEYSHNVVDVKRCLNHEKISDEVFDTIERLVKKYRIPVYDEDRKQGCIRHVLIRRAVKSNETLVCLVAASKQLPQGKGFVNDLITAHPEIKSVVLNVNMRKTSIVLGDEEKVLYGKGTVCDELCGLKFNISSRSFYQINHDQTERLYKKAIELMNPSKEDVVYDMYCGIGTIGLCCAQHVKQVVGVEVNAQAIKDAIVNAKSNKVENIRFVCADASDFMMKSAKEKKHIDCVFIDPPRSGCDERFLDALVYLKPKKIVYVSCDPSTQVRDLKYLFRNGYKAEDMYLVDMFPNTSHIESIVALSRAK